MLVIAPPQPMPVSVVTRAMSKLQILGTSEETEKSGILKLAESVQENVQALWEDSGRLKELLRKL